MFYNFGCSNYEFKGLNASALFAILCGLHYCAYLFCLVIFHDEYGVIEDDWQCRLCWSEKCVWKDGFKEEGFWSNSGYLSSKKSQIVFFFWVGGRKKLNIF